MVKRYDKKHRLLKTGETERTDGYYVYRWTGQDGKRRSVTAGTLEDLRRFEGIETDISCQRKKKRSTDDARTGAFSGFSCIGKNAIPSLVSHFYSDGWNRYASRGDLCSALGRY